MDLLELHPSFWDRRKGFYRWQLLRRKKEYRDAEVFKSQESSIFTDSFYSRFYQDYRPKPKQTFVQWSWRVIHFGPKAKELSGREREAILAPTLLPENLRLPARWPPVPPEKEFPHPYVLERLTDSGLGVAVVTVPFPTLKEIRVDRKSYWVDLAFPLREICSDIFGYLRLQGWRSWSGGRENLTADQVRERRRIEKLVKQELSKFTREKKRNPVPKRSKRNSLVDPLKLPLALVAWDMKQSGKSYRQIIDAIWPDEASRQKKQGKRLREAGSRSALLQRAKEHVKYADDLIKRAFSQ